MVKIAILLKQTTGAFQQHLQLNANHASSYNDVREVVLNYSKANTNPFKFDPVQQSTSMDVDYFSVGAFKGKGKGKDKGKGKGKGKVKGKD